MKQYITFTNNTYQYIQDETTGLRVRIGQRDGDYVEDMELEIGGFNLDENVGWENKLTKTSVGTGTKYRWGTRNHSSVVDGEITTLGFNGIEDIDWENLLTLFSYNSYWFSKTGGLISATVEEAEPTHVVLTFDIPLNVNIPHISFWALLLPNNTFESYSLDETGFILTFITASPVVNGNSVIIQYTKPEDNPLTYANREEANSFEFVCTNNVGGEQSLIPWETLKTTGENYWLILSGDKTGVSTLILKSNENITGTITGLARFYSDSGGTLNESATVELTANTEKTIYVRCTGDSVLNFPSQNKLTKISWASSTNAAYMFFDMSSLSALTYLSMQGNNYMYGSLTLLSTLTYYTHNAQQTDIKGDITNATGLTYFVELNQLNRITGDITYHVNLTLITVAGNFCTLHGDITNITGCSTFFVSGLAYFSGDISGFVNITSSLEIYGGPNTYTGSINGIVNVRSLVLNGNITVYGDTKYLANAWWIEIRGTGSTVVCTDASLMKECCYLMLVPGGHYASAEEVNGILAGFWANKDEPHALNNIRQIFIRGAQPTGQGLIDKAALEAYRTPNNDPTKNLWTVTIYS